MTKSSEHFAESATDGHESTWPSPGEIWPVYSGKSFNIWDPDTGDYYESVDGLEITQYLFEKRNRQHKVGSSAFTQIDPSVIADRSTLPCLRPRIAFMDVTNPTNQRTMIAALIPPNRVATHKAPYLLPVIGEPSDEAYVVAVLSSMVFDWQVRRTTETNITFTNLGNSSVPDPGPGHVVRDRVVEIGGLLAATDNRFDRWAAAVGVPVGSAADPAAKANLIAELEACVSLLYGLDEQDLEVIYSTFHRGPDFSQLKDAVLKHFRQISREAQRS